MDWNILGALGEIAGCCNRLKGMNPSKRASLLLEFLCWTQHQEVL
jgi:hypothetical protein